MRGLKSLFLGLFATFAFSWLGLALIPNAQIGHLEPQMDEEGTDIYPMPLSGMAERGRKIYTANGCFYCHSQQVRADYAAADIQRKWGERRSAPRDYIFARPVMLGKSRMGPDLANLGKRAPADDQNAPAPGASPAGSAAPGASPAAAGGTAASPVPAAGSSPAPVVVADAKSPAPAPAAAGASPAGQATSLDSAPATGAPPVYSAAWHHQHLYSPRSISRDSNMPAYHFLYEKRRVTGERSADALTLKGAEVPPNGWEIVPTYEAKALVAYLMSLDQSHPLKELQSAAAAPAASPAAPGKAVTK